jgi:hypothetical protein
LFSAIAPDVQRQEILDWFHLKENLYKVKATQQELAEVETCLWQGKVEAAIEQLRHCTDEQVQTFVGYSTHHRTRIINYAYFQAEGISIGSGAIESTVKQIGARIKLSGAQWKSENVPQVLLHRCAYLNSQSETYKTGMHPLPFCPCCMLVGTNNTTIDEMDVSVESPFGIDLALKRTQHLLP